MADHNDPNAVNSAFSDVDVSAADLYDLFGFPSADTAGGEKVAIALTMATVPNTGVFDSDMLYRVQMSAAPRATLAPGTRRGEPGRNAAGKCFCAVKDKYLGNFHAAEIRVTVDAAHQAHLAFLRFPGGDFKITIPTNQVQTIQTPNGHSIQAYIGGREEAFFNDLPGFFRSINYAPQFYHVPHTMTEARELQIPKTLLELEGNDLFNFDPATPQWGKTTKKDLPPGPWTWKGDKFKKDANGNLPVRVRRGGCARGEELQRGDL